MRRSTSGQTGSKVLIPPIVIMGVCVLVLMILFTWWKGIWRNSLRLATRLIIRKPSPGTRPKNPESKTAARSPTPAFRQVMLTTNEGQTLTVVPVNPASPGADPISYQGHRATSCRKSRAGLRLPIPPPVVSRDPGSSNQTVRFNGTSQQRSDSQVPCHRTRIRGETPPVSMSWRPPLRLDTSGTIISTARLRASRITNRGGMTALPLYSPGPPSYGQSSILGA